MNWHPLTNKENANKDNRLIMNRQIPFASIMMLLLLTGCSPRVTTDITMSYPARSVEEVKVYDVGDTVPNSAMAIGKVAVLEAAILNGISVRA